MQANAVHPLDLSGHRDDQNGSIVVLFIGFSNCEIEICGGQYDAWHLALQPCATDCNNPLKNPPTGYQPWNTAPEDPTNTPQQSLLYQIYSPSTPLVGAHVYLFNGAKGHRPFEDWDPFSTNNRCPSDMGPECNYMRVSGELSTNGFSNNQVQVVFVYDSTNYPTCDLSGSHCTDPVNNPPDAYLSEQYLGDIMRYLKQGYNGNLPRYPNLQQVFIVSRNYGGYAKNPPSGTTGCLSPEPFAYEEGFGVQRLIVAQIRQVAGLPTNDIYSGVVQYTSAPWFDWGPYLWASGEIQRSDLLNWCNGQADSLCAIDAKDFRRGDVSLGQYGDLTHPAHTGQTKAATQIKNFLLNSALTQAWIQQ